MAGDALDAFKIHVTAELAFVIAVHAHVDHHRAGFHHVGGQHVALADGGHDHIGLQRHGFQVGGGTVAQGDRGVFLQQHQRHGLADDVAAANHHGMLAAQIVADAVQHLHAAIRRAGPEARLAHHQGAGAGDVETVHVFCRCNRFNDFLRINVRGQRQLHQDAVDGGVLVERFHARQQFGFGQGGGVLLQHRVQAGVMAGLDLVAHIDLAGRVFADQHHGQTRRDATGAQGGRALGDFGPQLFGEGVAVDEMCGHFFLRLLSKKAR